MPRKYSGIEGGVERRKIIRRKADSCHIEVQKWENEARVPKDPSLLKLAETLARNEGITRKAALKKIAVDLARRYKTASKELDEECLQGQIDRRKVERRKIPFEYPKK
ncbi:MAG: hypothetical protein V1494_01555 [Candidatus Diapherotrites archaeon]